MVVQRSTVAPLELVSLAAAVRTAFDKFVNSSKRSAIGRAARASRFGVSEEMTNERIFAECPRIVQMPEQLFRSDEKGNAIPVVACHGGFRLRRAGLRSS